MTTVHDELRRVLRELAEEGRPVNLGRAALAGARRRRRAHLGVAAVAVTAAAALAVPVALAEPPSGSSLPVAAPGGGGGSVVTSYQPADVEASTMVLNPETGEYRPADDLLGVALGERPRYVTVSPDLRHVAATQNAFRLRVASTVNDDEARVIELPAHGRDPVWSPDSARIVLGGSPPADDWRYLDRVVVAEVGTGGAVEVTLDFPAGRAGYRTSGQEVGWLDAGHLVVATVDLTRRYLVPPETLPVMERVPLITGLSIFDLDGTLVSEVEIDQRELTSSSQPHAGMMWAPHLDVRDGRVLLTRQIRPGTLELAVLDLTTGRLVTGPVSATLPAVELPLDLRRDGQWLHPDSGSYVSSLLGIPRNDISPDGEFHRTPMPRAWLHDTAVLVDTGQWGWEAGFTVPREHHVVDLATGQWHPATVSVAAPHEWVWFGDAAGLSPQARDRAHLLELGASG
jgi:hypothetical protein